VEQRRVSQQQKAEVAQRMTRHARERAAQRRMSLDQITETVMLGNRLPSNSRPDADVYVLSSQFHPGLIRRVPVAANGAILSVMRRGAPGVQAPGDAEAEARRAAERRRNGL
jgi:hypothetical protein